MSSFRKTLNGIGITVLLMTALIDNRAFCQELFVPPRSSVPFSITEPTQAKDAVNQSALGRLGGQAGRGTNIRDLSPLFSDLLPNSVVLGSVVCEADFSFADCEDFQTDLIELQEDLSNYLGVPEPNEKIVLCLFANWDSYRRFLDVKFPQVPRDRPALYVKGSGPGVLMVVHDKEMRLNIRHEMTHAILNAALRNVPIWLDEGLAKYFEIPRGKRGFDNPFLSSVRRGTSFFSLFQKVPPLPRLEKLRYVQEMGVREYRESWSWVHFMIHYSMKTQKILGYYLLTLLPEKQKGISIEMAAEIGASAPLTQLLENWEPDYKKQYIEHFQNWDEEKRSEYMSE